LFCEWLILHRFLIDKKMKKAKLIIISSLTLLSLVLPNDCYAAKETVNMSSGGVEDWPVGNPYPKSPVEVPTDRKSVV
jgi:hypothetical protein